MPDRMVMTTTDVRFARLWAKIGEQQNRNTALCRTMLVNGYGVKIIHPDDGWVNREKNILTPCYPLLHDKSALPGDLIALGSPDTDERVIGHYRIVRITEVRKSPLMLTLTGDHGLSYVFEPHVERFEMTAPEQGCGDPMTKTYTHMQLVDLNGQLVGPRLPFAIPGEWPAWEGASATVTHLRVWDEDGVEEDVPLVPTAHLMPNITFLLQTLRGIGKAATP